jgi:DNA repair protein RecN (Recombination protein N)
MGRLARDHQILCITHLPQIAAMEDSHYLIAKHTTGERTQTNIRALSEDESDREVARLVGADLITDASLENAREMKRMARESKR